MLDRSSDGKAVLPQIGVGAVIWCDDALLLIRRAKPPLAGEWSIPGGRQELGETVAQALLREVREETGLTIEILGLIDVVDAIMRDGAGQLTHHYTLIDFSARWSAGMARPGGDAEAVAWVRLAELPRFSLWPETLRIIGESARLHAPRTSRLKRRKAGRPSCTTSRARSL